MSKQTSNYGFTKPDANEFYDVQVQNENWDKADIKLANALGIEDKTHPGCYYRMIGDEKEWLNPPMEVNNYKLVNNEFIELSEIEKPSQPNEPSKRLIC